MFSKLRIEYQQIFLYSIFIPNILTDVCSRAVTEFEEDEPTPRERSGVPAVVPSRSDR